MTAYTEDQAKMFENLLSKLKETPPYQLRVAGKTWILKDPWLVHGGYDGTFRGLMAIIRSPAWTAWFKDYEEVQTLQKVSQAVELIPAELARLMAREQRNIILDARMTGGRRRDIAAESAAYVANKRTRAEPLFDDGDDALPFREPDGDLVPEHPGLASVSLPEHLSATTRAATRDDAKPPRGTKGVF